MVDLSFLTMFWDFFFAPLYALDGLPVVFSVLALCLVCLAVSRFLEEVFSCFM